MSSPADNDRPIARYAPFMGKGGDSFDRARLFNSPFYSVLRTQFVQPHITNNRPFLFGRNRITALMQNTRMPVECLASPFWRKFSLQFASIQEENVSGSNETFFYDHSTSPILVT
jgi:hypothetical protein